MSNLTVTSLFLHYLLFSTDAAIRVTYTEYLKCHYDQIFDIHFFTFPYAVSLF